MNCGARQPIVKVGGAVVVVVAASLSASLSVSQFFICLSVQLCVCVYVGVLSATPSNATVITANELNLCSL